MLKYLFGVVTLSMIVVFCLAEKKRTLPILGERDVVNGDTIYPTVPDFAFINQDSQLVTNATFAGKIYVVDFFFIHCPTICPKVKANGLRPLHRRAQRHSGSPQTPRR